MISSVVAMARAYRDGLLHAKPLPTVPVLQYPETERDSVARWLDDGGAPYERQFVHVADIRSGMVLLNGHGEALPQNQPPVWLAIRRGKPEVNSAGERFQPSISWEQWDDQ